MVLPQVLLARLQQPYTVKVVQVLKQVLELALVRTLLGGDPLDPPFYCMELYLKYIIVESTRFALLIKQAICLLNYINWLLSLSYFRCILFQPCRKKALSISFSIMRFCQRFVVQRQVLESSSVRAFRLFNEYFKAYKVSSYSYSQV